MTVEPITLLHGAMVALLTTSSLGSFAASYVFWVVKGPAPDGRTAQCPAAQSLPAPANR
jgi:hypothetical protein